MPASQSIPTEILQCLKAFTNRYPSLKSAPVWGIAASGGADSTALALAVAELGQPAVLLHVNYGLRGAESEADQAFVEALARQLGFPCRVQRIETATAAEDELRRLRYAWFDNQELSAIFTAHTLDDQAETLIHRLFRGTGIEGLEGIHPAWKDRYFRPLLSLRRHYLRSYLSARAQVWREDASNQNPAYRRNWIRHHLIPQAEANLNPALVEALGRLAQLASDEEHWIDALVRHRLPEFVQPLGRAMILEAAALSREPAAFQRRVLRQILRGLQDFEPGDELGFEHIEALRELCSQEEGSGRLQVPGIDALRSFGQVRFARQRELNSEARNYRLPLHPPAEIPLPENAGFLAADLANNTIAEISQYNESGEILDWDQLALALEQGHSLSVRNWRPGDDLHRAGRETPDKLKELFQKFRIPLWERRNWPIVVLDDVPVWCRRFGPSARFVAGPTTKRVLRLQWKSSPGNPVGTVVGS